MRFIYSIASAWFRGPLNTEASAANLRRGFCVSFIQPDESHPSQELTQLPSIASAGPLLGDFAEHTGSIRSIEPGA